MYVGYSIVTHPSCCAAMTTSHRPTFAPALGGAPIAISTSISSKDGNLQPIKLRCVFSHFVLKGILLTCSYSESMPSADRDLKAELFRREQLASGKKTGGSSFIFVFSLFLWLIVACLLF